MIQNGFKQIGSGIKSAWHGIGRYFADFVTGIIKGDIAVKLSLLIMGAGYFRRKQYVKGLIMCLYEVLFIAFTIFFACPNLAKFSTLGTVQREVTFDFVTMKNIENDYDDSFKILLYSIISLVVIAGTVLIYIHNIKAVYKLQKLAEAGEHINSFKDDIRLYKNDKFYVTLLFLPCTGIMIFTIIPLFVIISVAFTNYDQAHMSPTLLFTWVGLENFKNLFTIGITDSFGYAFGKVLSWTFIWAVFATVTTFIGGIMMAMFINSPKTKLPKLWRTLLMITIAIPQFVSLLLVRNFFANTGIVNTICMNIGLTPFLQNIGLVPAHLSYIPFLTDPNWAKVMIILINIWIGIPYQMLIATGILMNIPADLMESAKIDGANKMQIFIKITMPYILFIQGPALVTDFIKNINNFNVIYLLTQDVYRTTDQAMAAADARETDLLVTWLFRLTQENYNYKMAAVIGAVVFVISAAFTLVTFNQLVKGDKEGDFQ